MVNDTASRSDRAPIDGQIFYYSCPPVEISSVTMGKTHYSYRFASNKFIDALQGARAFCKELRMPEFYGNANALVPESELRTGQDRKFLHLIFRSTEDIRLLKFGYNIACFAWEFEVLNNRTEYDGNILANQVHMLSLCQELWVPCSFTKTVLEKYGFGNVQVIPAPIRMEAGGAMSRHEAFASLSAVPAFPLNFNPNWRETDTVAWNKTGQRPLLEWLEPGRFASRVFLSVLNPEDDRKNIDAMLTAFFNFNRLHPDAMLIVKLVTSLERYGISTGQFMHRVIGRRIKNGSALQGGQIYFITDYLSDRTMQLLYKSADFYLCTSIAEGQNLPLMEAMANGVVPIAPRHTAMADYLGDDNSIPIDFVQVDNFFDNLAPTGLGFRSFQINYSSANDVLKALKKASTLSGDQYRALSARAVETIRDAYSSERIVDMIQERTQAI